MEVVIVTCLADRLHFLILCKTMGKHLSPCRCTIIINERDNNLIFLKSWIEDICLKYIPLHNVRILSEEEIHPGIHKLRIDGWKSQQLLKLLYFKKTKSKSYWVLDSKNWFVKDCTIEMIAKSNPARFVPAIIPSMISEIKKRLSPRLKNIKKVNMVSPYETPFLIKENVVRYIIGLFKNTNKFMMHFKYDRYPSEFMIHSFVDDIINVNDQYDNNRIHRTIWKSDLELHKKTCLELWEESQKNEDYLILSIHKFVLRKISLDEFEKILNTLNFTIDSEIQEILNSNIKNQNVPTLEKI